MLIIFSHFFLTSTLSFSLSFLIALSLEVSSPCCVTPRATEPPFFPERPLGLCVDAPETLNGRAPGGQHRMQVQHQSSFYPYSARFPWLVMTTNKICWTDNQWTPQYEGCPPFAPFTCCHSNQGVTKRSFLAKRLASLAEVSKQRAKYTILEIFTFFSSFFFNN